MTIVRIYLKVYDTARFYDFARIIFYKFTYYLYAQHCNIIQLVISVVDQRIARVF